MVYGDFGSWGRQKNKANFIVQRSAFSVLRKSTWGRLRRSPKDCVMRTVPARREKRNLKKQSQFISG